MELLHLFSQKSVFQVGWCQLRRRWFGIPDPEKPPKHPEANNQNPANVIQGPSAGASKLGNPKKQNPKQKSNHFCGEFLEFLESCCVFLFFFLFLMWFLSGKCWVVFFCCHLRPAPAAAVGRTAAAKLVGNLWVLLSRNDMIFRYFELVNLKDKDVRPVLIGHHHPALLRQCGLLVSISDVFS